MKILRAELHTSVLGHNTYEKQKIVYIEKKNYLFAAIKIRTAPAEIMFSE